MKPLHASVTRIHRCRCCQSKYSRGSKKKMKCGKKADRFQAKKDIQRQL